LRTLVCILLLGLSVVCVAQEVAVSSGKNSVILSVSAQKSYDVLSGEKKTPVLSVQCVLKGKKEVHIITFSPGGAVIEDKPDADQVSFTVTMGGAKHLTTWVNFGDTVTFAFYGKLEPERLQFINALLDAGMISIDFSPFLTGQTMRTTFDLSKLRAEMAAHPECALK
jgi:hypothetical protein